MPSFLQMRKLKRSNNSSLLNSLKGNLGEQPNKPAGGEKAAAPTTAAPTTAAPTTAAPTTAAPTTQPAAATPNAIPIGQDSSIELNYRKNIITKFTESVFDRTGTLMYENPGNVKSYAGKQIFFPSTDHVEENTQYRHFRGYALQGIPTKALADIVTGGASVASVNESGYGWSRQGWTAKWDDAMQRFEIILVDFDDSSVNRCYYAGEDQVSFQGYEFNTVTNDPDSSDQNAGFCCTGFYTITTDKVSDYPTYDKIFKSYGWLGTELTGMKYWKSLSEQTYLVMGKYIVVDKTNSYIEFPMAFSIESLLNISNKSNIEVNKVQGKCKIQYVSKSSDIKFNSDGTINHKESTINIENLTTTYAASFFVKGNVEQITINFNIGDVLNTLTKFKGATGLTYIANNIPIGESYGKRVNTENEKSADDAVYIDTENAANAAADAADDSLNNLTITLGSGTILTAENNYYGFDLRLFG